MINKTVKKASTLTEEKLITAMGFPKIGKTSANTGCKCKTITSKIVRNIFVIL